MAEEYLSGVVIVVMRAGVSDARCREIFAECDCTIVRRLKRIRTYILSVPDGQEESTLAVLKTYPEVEAGILNQKMVDS